MRKRDQTEATTQGTFEDGDRVWTFDWDGTKVFGNIFRNPYPVSEWYIIYDDGQDYAVFNLGLIFKVAT